MRAHPEALDHQLDQIAQSAPGLRRHRGRITTAGNQQARRLLVEAAWRYRHPPRRSKIATPAEQAGPEQAARAWAAQVRPHHRRRGLVQHGRRSTIAEVAVARELVGFIWAAMTEQAVHQELTAA